MEKPEYVLPSGSVGQQALVSLGISNSDVQTLTKLPIVSKDNNPIKVLVNQCESVTSWDCTALDNPDFAANCGLCTSKGKNSMGKSHIGGMYVDPDVLEEMKNKYSKTGSYPKINPTIGKCEGEFIYGRPFCDTQKDRKECAEAKSFTSPGAKEKCGMCVESQEPTFVYMGKRGDADTKYALIPDTGAAPYKFKTRLRVVISNTKDCTIYLRNPLNPNVIDPITNMPKEIKYPGALATGSNVYLVDLSGVTENQPFDLVVKWPEYLDAPYTAEDTKRIAGHVNPVRAPLARATYGPWTGDFLVDDERAVDVSSYLKNRFKTVADCAEPIIKVSNDGAGGDPTPGIVKQLRLSYSFDGHIFAYAFGKEGDDTKVEDQGEEGQIYRRLCPPSIDQKTAEQKVCTTDAFGNPIKKNSYTGDTQTIIKRQFKFWGSTGTTTCVKDAVRPQRGISGMWESLGRAPRIVLLEKSVVKINNVTVPVNGLPNFGTMISNVFRLDNKITSAMNIPNHAKWFWPEADEDGGGVHQVVVFSIVVPATMRDTSLIADTHKCSGGPIITTPEAAKRMRVDPCDHLVNGKLQKPGSYSDACVKNIFLANGCTRKGKAYPDTLPKKAKLAGAGMDVKAVTSVVKDIYLTATTGSDITGTKASGSQKANAVDNCFGNYVADPCNTSVKDFGPQSIDCLDYLWRNEGRKNKMYGPTYPASEKSRSSGAGTPENPSWWCQRAGSMSPINLNGSANMQAVTAANANGSVSNIMKYYAEVHRVANYETDSIKQCTALDFCYGIKVCGKKTPVITDDCIKAIKDCKGDPKKACEKTVSTCSDPKNNDKPPCSGGGPKDTPPVSVCPGGAAACPGNSCPNPTTGKCPDGSTCPGLVPKPDGPCNGGQPKCPDGKCPDSTSGLCDDGKPPTTVPPPPGFCSGGTPTCTDGSCPDPETSLCKDTGLPPPPDTTTPEKPKGPTDGPEGIKPADGTPTVCILGETKCPDGSCVAVGANCPVNGETCPGPSAICSVCTLGQTKCENGSCAPLGTKCPGTTCPGGVTMCKDRGCPDPITGICKDDPTSTVTCPGGKSCNDGSCADPATGLCKDTKLPPTIVTPPTGGDCAKNPKAPGCPGGPPPPPPPPPGVCAKNPNAPGCRRVPPICTGGKSCNNGSCANPATGLCDDTNLPPTNDCAKNPNAPGCHYNEREPEVDGCGPGFPFPCQPREVCDKNPNAPGCRRVVDPPVCTGGKFPCPDGMCANAITGLCITGDPPPTNPCGMMIAVRNGQGKVIGCLPNGKTPAENRCMMTPNAPGCGPGSDYCKMNPNATGCRQYPFPPPDIITPRQYSNPITGKTAAVSEVYIPWQPPMILAPPVDTAGR